MNILSVGESAPHEQDLITIPIDCYRILGVLPEATQAQIAQAYHDRSLQMPRSEYSDTAISVRQQLISKSYQILTDPAQRQSYDRQFFTSEAKAKPTLEIKSSELVGALLLLQDLGEYNQVLQLGETYLQQTAIKQLHPLSEEHKDVVLSLALANLELGREKWQQGKYEKAGFFFNNAADLLEEDPRFLNIQKEIKLDLYRLRPYRIIELLTLNLSQKQERSQGLFLFQEMLEQRQGIEGKGEDYSDLNVEELLSFIQQVQGYMTVSEQQAIFVKEANRPSPVAAYLAFYALLARGFAEKKPELIVQGKHLLNRFSKQQDVYLEQAVSYLLLGQTEAALAALNNSQEKDTLAFIKDQSKQSPDLLPGLCMYAERWLQLEVFSHFRDLVKQPVSLNEYFADPHVQNYLDTLLLKTEGKSDQISPSNGDKFTSNSREEVRGTWDTTYHPHQEQSVTEQLYQASSLNSLNQSDNRTSPKLELSFNDIQRDKQPRKYQPGKAVTVKTAKSQPNSKDSLIPATRVKNSKSQLPQPHPYWWRIVIATLLGIGFLTVLQILWRKQWANTPELSLSLNQPVVAIPSPTPSTSESTVRDATTQIRSLDISTAEATINQWLQAKSQAYGPNHEISSLENILVDPLLTEKVRIANLVQNQNSYRLYEHSLKVDSVKVNPQDPTQGSAIALVREVAKYYQNQQFLPNQSYSSSLQVRYDLVLVEGKWLIKQIQVIK